MVLEWIASNWSDLLRHLFKGTDTLRERNFRRAETHKAITEAYGKLWAEIRSRPEYGTMFDRHRDLKLQPRTECETHYVRLALQHASVAFTYHKAGAFALPEKLGHDVRDFFSFPLVRDAWQELRAFHDSDFVALIEKELG